MMKRKDQHKSRQTERGNVLFLILIAVALFAALSYAVTQSGGGSGDAGNETTGIQAAQLTQYPASIRTAIVRMIINGTAVEDLSFNPATDFANLGNTSNGVFHPAGGGAATTPAPADVMASGTQGTWFFNGQMEIPFIGTSGADGNDLIAFLPGLKGSVCRKLNEELGLGNVTPQLNGDRDGDYKTNMIDDDANVNTVPTNFPTGSDEPDIDDGSNSFDGRPFGCFQNQGSGDEFVYYHVLVER